jgi:hypothetical protein
MQILTTEATDESDDGDGNGTDDNCHCNDDPVREEGFLSVNTIFTYYHTAINLSKVTCILYGTYNYYLLYSA